MPAARDDDKSMNTSTSQDLETPISAMIRSRIEQGGESLWQFQDFAEFSATATAQTLSRLTREGVLRRVAKGIYYKPAQSIFGETKPRPKALRVLAAKKQRLFPAGLSAANLLGFSTQTPRRIELSTPSASVQRRLLGSDTIVYTRRPAAWLELTDEQAALLEVLRDGAELSELSLPQTTARLLELLGEKRRFEKLVQVADSEPPRVQALLGAAGQELGKSRAKLLQLRSNLNPLSRYDFGRFSSLRHAQRWQAKDGSQHETVRTPRIRASHS